MVVQATSTAHDSRGGSSMTLLTSYGLAVAFAEDNPGADVVMTADMISVTSPECEMIHEGRTVKLGPVQVYAPRPGVFLPVAAGLRP